MRNGCHGCNGCSHPLLSRLRGHGCNGCNGCNGCTGCNGWACNGCNGWACNGCNGWACHGYAAPACHGYAAPACHGCAGGVIVIPAAGAAGEKKEMPKPDEKKPEEKKPQEKAHLPAPATLIVSLPADAKLLIDDHATTSTSATRVFVSPTLVPGKVYQYELKAEIVRAGQKVTTAKQVEVRAGLESRVTLSFPTEVAAK
jgi:uncharacterized protein (TIGR03000 family)